MAAARLLLRPFFFLFIFLVLSPITCSMNESDALLKLKKSFTNAGALNSWVPGSPPCNGAYWVGLVCYDGIVTGLRLGGMGLSGKIDVNALLQLPGLRSISIKNNTLSGPIPKFSEFSLLKAIYLSRNQFSGEIPSDYFAKMKSLKKVFLSDNKFTGEIPSSLAKLPSLVEVRLENNQFNGSIPTLDQPTLTAINVSNNKLEGEIPANYLSRFNANSFAGNAGLCGGNFGKECPTALEQQFTDTHKNGSNRMIAAIIITVVALISIVVVVIVRLKPKPKPKTEEFDVFEVHEKGNADEPVEVHVSHSGPNKKEPYTIRRGGSSSSSRRASNHGKGGGGGVGELIVLNQKKGIFGLSDLMKASAEVLANGVLGFSYKAVMSNGVAVVVKRMKEMNTLGRDAFDVEMRHLAKLRHPNILTPLAYHYRKEEKLLVSEYIPNGSLLYLLHGDRGPSHAELNWPTRLKIVKGIAQGMGHVHKQLTSSSIPHGNLKSSNILLGPDYEPLLSDYGLVPLINPAHAAQAFFAYKAPEAAQLGQVSPKCDVYCLGIVILEILTGKYPSQYLNNNKGGIDLVQWVASAIADGRESELFDPEIVSFENSLDEMERLLHIGAACTESHPDQRLDMMEAIRIIEDVQVEGEGTHDQVSRTMYVLPSLRDGYADSLPSAHVLRGSQESLGVNSSRRRGSDSFLSQSGRHIDDSFAFHIS